MHDTPGKSLFNRTVRAYSHGCIRLEKPMELLNELGYTYDTRRNKWITLKKQIPVYVEYHTVWVEDDGIVQFRNDIYGYEKKLFSKTTYHPTSTIVLKKKVVKKQKVLGLF